MGNCQGPNGAFNYERGNTMDNLNEMFESEFEAKQASSVEKVDQGGLTSVAAISRQILATETTIAALEQHVKEEKKSLLKLTDEELPAMLNEMGISKFSLDDGSEVVVKQTYGGSITQANKEEAHGWLRQYGHDDIIKNTVTCQFGRGEDDQAAAFSTMAEEKGFAPEQKTAVHPQTLRAWVKEQTENGNEFPMDLFGAFIGQRATIKRSK
jgi:hypothetical protein